jgi:hypothetical protein
VICGNGMSVRTVSFGGPPAMLPFDNIFHERNQLLVARAGVRGFTRAVALRRAHEMQ